MNRIWIALSVMVLLLGTVIQANAQGPNVDTDAPPTQDGGPGMFLITPNAAQQAVTAGTFVLSRNFTIQPGRYADFRLPTTYSLDLSSNVAISINAPNHNLAGTFLVPYFAAPGAIYTAADVIDCSQFLFATQGGSVVPVYGSHLVVRVYNLSGRPVTYAQLMVHWSGH